MWPQIDPKRALQLLSLSRECIHKVVGVITDHTLIGTHSKVMGLGHLTNDFCRSCRDEEEEESVLHLLGTCPALSKKRKDLFGFYFSNNLSDFDNINIPCLLRFIESSKWF